MASRPSAPAARPRRYAVLAAVAALALPAVALAGCSQNPNSVAAQANAGDQKGYIAGDGAIETIPPDKRGAPVDLNGTTVTGRSWSSTTARGRYLVVNVWGSWCGPCISEADGLQKAWEQVQAAKEPVQFIGIDYREDPARGAAFLASRKITYPSLSDQSGVLILDLQGKAPTIPTTLVLDTQGRIAARVSGAVDTATLVGLISDTMSGS